MAAIAPFGQSHVAIFANSGYRLDQRSGRPGIQKASIPDRECAIEFLRCKEFTLNLLSREFGPRIYGYSSGIMMDGVLFIRQPNASFQAEPPFLTIEYFPY